MSEALRSAPLFSAKTQMLRGCFHIAFVAMWMLTLTWTHGTLQAQKEPNAVPSDEAKALHAEAREAGARGDYAAALTLLTKAAALAPDWPYPVYDRAFTHVLMNNFAAALADYQETLKLAPRGFFTAHVAVDTVLRENRGEFPPGLYLAYVMLEFEQDRERRPTILQEIVNKFPRFAPGWEKFAEFADTPQERLERIEVGLAADPDPETLGTLKLNQAAALEGLGKPDAAADILRALVSDPKSTLATVSLAKFMLTRK
jgi:tetratricopeptide (TPR) repeat protein